MVVGAMSRSGPWRAGALAIALLACGACITEAPADNPDEARRAELTRARRSGGGEAVPSDAERLLAEAAAHLEAGEVARARELYELAAAAGEPRAHLALGLLDEGAAGGAAEVSAAIRHHEAAARAGLAEGQYRLALLLLDPEGPAPDPARGLEWLEAAARQDHAPAQLALATALLGLGDAASQEVGATWLQRAAEGGVPEAQHRLGLVLVRSGGGPSATAEAVRWWTRAATAGNPEAAHDLALAWIQGRGVLADPARGLQWMERAARGGHRRACLRLASMYERGVGTPVDGVRSLAWFRVAEALARGDGEIRDARVGVTRLEAALSESDRQAAQALATDLLEAVPGRPGA